MQRRKASVPVFIDESPINLLESDRTTGNKMKVLSTTWVMNSDSLFISGCDISASPVTTKREALQFVSKIHGPFEFLSPVTLKGKLFIQELWQQALDWDETPNSSQQDKRCKLHEDLLPLSSLPIPRYIGAETTTNYSASVMHPPRHIQQRYSCTLQWAEPQT